MSKLLIGKLPEKVAKTPRPDVYLSDLYLISEEVEAKLFDSLVYCDHPKMFSFALPEFAELPVLQPGHLYCCVTATTSCRFVKIPR